MEFRLLGPVEAWANGRKIDLGPRKQRLILAVLALEVNHSITIERLVDLTWPDSPPKTARHAIHVRVSNLRSALARARAHNDRTEIVTHGSTYVLRSDPARVDAHRFQALVANARDETDDDEKASLLRHALAIWNGPPLADVVSPLADHLCRGLEETRLAAMEEWLDVELQLGRHSEIIGELTEVAGLHPNRQRLLGQLMLALYRAGRAPDALDAYRRARRRLIEDFGIEPELAVQRLEYAILHADPTLDPAPQRWRRKRTNSIPEADCCA